MTPVKHLAGSTLGLVGLDGIGLEMAARSHISGMRVIAVDPALKGTPDYVEAVYPPDELHQMLAQADFIAISL